MLGTEQYDANTIHVTKISTKAVTTARALGPP